MWSTKKMQDTNTKLLSNSFETVDVENVFCIRSVLGLWFYMHFQNSVFEHVHMVFAMGNRLIHHGKVSILSVYEDSFSSIFIRWKLGILVLSLQLLQAHIRIILTSLYEIMFTRLANKNAFLSYWNCTLDIVDL